MNEVHLFIIRLFCLYYTIGTLFLLMFISGRIKMTPKNEMSKLMYQHFGNIIITSLCLYWPFLIILLWKGMKNNEDTK